MCEAAVGTFAIGQTTDIGFVLIQEDNNQTATTGDVVCSCPDEVLIVSSSLVKAVIAVSIHQHTIPIPAIQRVIARAAEQAVATAEAIDAGSSFRGGTAVAGF